MHLLPTGRLGIILVAAGFEVEVEVGACIWDRGRGYRNYSHETERREDDDRAADMYTCVVRE